MKKLGRNLVLFATFVAHLLCAPLIAYSNTLSMKRFDYDKVFDQIDTLLKKQHYKDACKKSIEAMQSGMREKLSTETLIAAAYVAECEKMHEEECLDKAIARYEEILPLLDGSDKAMCRLLLTKSYDHVSFNLTTGEDERKAKAKLHKDSLMSDAELLWQTPAKRYERILSKSEKDGILLTPTLLDLVAQELINQSLGNAERLQLLTMLADKHANDPQKDGADSEAVRIYIDIKIAELHVEDVKDTEAKLAEWRQLIAKYSNSTSPLVSRLYHKVASILNDSERYVEAIAYCDTAIKNYKYDEGTNGCCRIREKITAPVIRIGSQTGQEASEKESMIAITVRNIEKIYCRIIKDFAPKKQGDDPTKYEAQKEWSQEVPSNKEYREELTYCYLPAMPAGHYMLIISPTEKFDEGITSYYYNNGRMVVLTSEHDEIGKLCGRVLDRYTGKPIKDVVVSNLKTNEKYVTGNDGYYSLSDTKNRNSQLQFEYNGEVFQSNYSPCFDRTEKATSGCTILTDRPIYRLGEEIQTTAIVYSGKRLDVKPTAEASLQFTLHKSWSSDDVLDTKTATTDEYGRATVALMIPESAIPGNYTIDIKSNGKTIGSEWVSIEQYKQPKFRITLTEDDEEKSIGDTLRIHGEAKSYSGVAVSDAKVSYSIERSKIGRWWWNREETVAITVGETTSDDEGMFEITFKDTMANNDDTYLYIVHATVTDINGETHNATYSKAMGKNDVSLTINNADESDHLDEIAYDCTNMKGKAIEKEVAVTVERLTLPSRPRIQHPNYAAAHKHAISEAEFDKRFADFSYTSNDINQLPVEALCHNTKVRSSSTGGNSVKIGALEDGIYRIKLSANNKAGDTIECSKIVTITGKAAKKVQSPKLLWCRADKTEAAPGDTVNFYIGSRYNDVDVYYEILLGSQLIERKKITIDNEIKKIAIPVGEKMMGGFAVNCVAIRYNIKAQKLKAINVPFRDKKLNITFESFRDKVEPGKAEQWKIKIADYTGKPVPAAAILTLYDAALDVYHKLNWSLQPWLRNNTSQSLSFHEKPLHAYGMIFNFSSTNHYQSSGCYDPIKNHSEVKEFTEYVITKGLPESFMRSTMVFADMCRMTMMSKGARSVKYSISNVDDAAELVDEEAVEKEAIDTTSNEDKKAEEIEYRDNLSTLGLHLPKLQSDKDGSITIDFTTPEALTEWHLLSLAYTKELAVGSSEKRLTTCKPLMVEPLIPRYMREGDSMTLRVKVMNQSDNDETATVRIQLADAETGKEWQAEQSQTIAVRRGENAMASFDIVVPGGSNMVCYEVRATGSNNSDGERNLVQVLSNRQLVTQSQAMYINGKGEKRYTLPTLTMSDTRKIESLTVEYTNNPVWHAIYSLPYVKEKENPSNIYLCNAVYANKLSQRIIDENPDIEQVILEDKEGYTSRLNENIDIKGDDDTPYKHAARAEEQRAREVATFFDKERIDKEVGENVKKLCEQQKTDGGWSWMPDGDESSEYTTRYILKTLGQLRQSERQDADEAIRKALQYLDNEVDKTYQRLKKYKVKDGQDYDYLYIRSLYQEHSVSSVARKAYDYYFENAKKSSTETINLYAKAELALIMHRGGEEKTARELLTQLMQRSLQNDEMGIYWRENVNGFYWYERPIEVQSLIIEAFAEVMPEATDTIGKLQQWLLKQKQTTSWQNDIASVKAIAALLLEQNCKKETQPMPGTISCGGYTIECKGATGYARKRWEQEEIDESQREITLTQSGESIGWGAAYLQYSDEIDKIDYSEMGVKLRKVILRKDSQNNWRELKAGETVALGEKLRVEILIECDRTLEFLELSDGRASNCEPIDTRSGWRWNHGLSYYMAVMDSETKMYIDHLSKGKYVVSYEMLVNLSGVCNSGVTTIQSLYAPEFRSTAASVKMKVE